MQGGHRAQGAELGRCGEHLQGMEAGFLQLDALDWCRLGDIPYSEHTCPSICGWEYITFILDLKLSSMVRLYEETSTSL